MSILAKYVCKEFLKILMLCLFIFVVIYLVIHFFGRLDNFAEAHVPISRMLPFLMYQIPYIIVEMLPPASLIAVIIMFSLMKKNNEIMALKASGISILKVAQPVIISSLVLSFVLFLFSEIIVPFASARSNKIWRTEVKKQKPGSFYGTSHIWYKGSDCIYWIRHFDNEKAIMSDPVFYFFDQSFQLVKKIDGRSGIWKNSMWEITDGTILELAGDGSYRMRRFKKTELNLPETPETFVQEQVKPEEMGYRRLRQFAQRIRAEGYDATSYFVDLDIKVSFPFVVFFMALIGTPIALTWKKGGTPVAVSIGILLCFIYLLVFGVSRSLGYAGALPPIFSAWLANGVFFFLGIYLMMRVDG
jgi:lipopolysaccharide export system permease protein